MTGEQNVVDDSSLPTGPWEGSFDVGGTDGGAISLFQIGRKTFALTSKIHYRGETGLEDKNLSPEVLAEIRTLDPVVESDGFYETDLASVPGATRWFLGTYGVHTPAVLIHDRLIPTPPGLEGMTEPYADRYLRFMLQDLGVRWLKRWVMWAAVALRTRWAAGGWRRFSVAVWVLAALAGIATFVVAAVNGNVALMLAALVAPLPFALLWGKQYGAGLIAAIAAPWLLPPTVFAALGYGVYLASEFVVGLFIGDRRGTGTYRPDGL